MLKSLQLFTFFGLLLVSIGLSILLYTGFAINTLSFIVLLIIAFSAETLKVLTLVTANTNFYQASEIKNSKIEYYLKGLFNKKNRDKVKEGTLLKKVLSYERHRRRAITYIFVYAFTAFLSISASFGYVVQTINTFSDSKVVLQTNDTQALYQEKIKAYADKIFQYQKINKDYAIQQEQLDTLYDEKYQSKYDAYQAKIDKNNLEIQKQLDLKMNSNELLQNLKLADIASNRTHEKSVYTLMGDALNLPSKTIMYILLSLLSILIEIGILFTSPHFNIMDKEDEETEDRVKKITIPALPIESKESIIESMYNPDSKSRMKVDKVIKPIETLPMDDDSHLVLTPEDYDALQEAIINPPIPTEALKDLMQERVSQPELLPVVEVVDVPIKHVDNAEVKVVNLDVPLVRKTVDKTKVIDAFIDNLFDENGRMLNKENVANKVGLSLIHAIKIVEFLTHSPYVQFRPPVSYFRIGTITDIKKAIGKLYSSGGTNEKV